MRSTAPIRARSPLNTRRKRLLVEPARRLHAILGKSPLAYFQSGRVKWAVDLLKTTQGGVDEMASRVGYADGVTLRTLLRRRLRGNQEDSDIVQRMILWTLRNYFDPTFGGGAMICAIERSEDGYRLLLEHNGDIQLHESHGRIETARGKAEMLKETFLKQGWREDDQVDNR